MEPPMVVSLFDVEIKLNIEFRKVLGSRYHAQDQMTDVETATPPPSLGHYAAGLDEDYVPSPPAEDNFNIPATPTPEISAAPGPTPFTPSTPNTPSGTDSPPSAVSIDGTGTASDNSSSPASHSSPTLTFASTTPSSSSASHTPPSSSSSPLPSSPTLFPYACSTCDLAFRTSGQLIKHRHRKHERRFLCLEPACIAAFHLKKDLERHVTSKHDDMVRTECVLIGCGKTFTRKDNMLRHMRKDHGMGEGRRVGR
ncbi:hypothetical protein EK21DRAFT_114246 [Setomelanomma holmii]|uniref:C2H2-type domain-containing protein n=1 Tax=Setomelanomma holmii TaxID=210430 RepID=A0A9P4H4H1_9PLEO|nr:hypothetical protein EK21DRAFT_114246 [Setomelanomma holmii]